MDLVEKEIPFKSTPKSENCSQVGSIAKNTEPENSVTQIHDKDPKSHLYLFRMKKKKTQKTLFIYLFLAVLSLYCCTGFP